MFNIKNYQKAASIEEAISLLNANQNSSLISGGTDILIKLQKENNLFNFLVDIHDINELKFIRINNEGDIVIGAGTPFTTILESSIIQEHIPILFEAVSEIGGPQIRNMGTIGGNICNGVTSADSVPPLLTLNAILTINGTKGERQIPIENFYIGPGKVSIEQSEILTSITIKNENYANYYGHFIKYAMRDAMDIATINCAALCKIENNLLSDLRLSYGVAAPVPLRCRNAEEIAKNKPITNELLNDISNVVLKDVNPRTSWRAEKEFRLHIIKELAKRTVKQAILNAGGIFH